MTINKHYPVTRYPTDIPGLLYRPSIEPEYSDGADHIEPFHGMVADETTPDQHYSAWNRVELTTCLHSLGLVEEGAAGVILEIGVAIVTDDRPFENTSTYILTERKADSVMYIGVDLAEDKRVSQDPTRNIQYLLGKDSRYWLLETYPGRRLEILRRGGIDLLHVDGGHSVATMLNDWRFTELLEPHGVAVFHDINVHPGPACVLDAVDPALFSVRAYFQNTPGDFGLAVVRRQRTAP